MIEPAARTDEGLWLPNTERPAWLDGSLPGDRGFDPLGLSKPTEYLQVRPRAADSLSVQFSACCCAWPPPRTCRYWLLRMTQSAAADRTFNMQHVTA